MLVYEFKAKGKLYQYKAIDEAIRTAQFVRNSCLRYWMDNRGLGRKELYRYNTELRAMYPFVKDLNSHASPRICRTVLVSYCQIFREL